MGLPYATDAVVRQIAQQEVATVREEIPEIVANPEMEGNEPALTGVEINGTKYVIENGGSSDLPFNAFHQILVDTTDSVQDIKDFLLNYTVAQDWKDALLEDNSVTTSTLNIIAHKISIQYNSEWVTSPILFTTSENYPPRCVITPEIDAETGEAVAFYIHFYINDTSTVYAHVTLETDPETGDSAVICQDIIFENTETSTTYTNDEIWQVINKIIISR